MCLSFEFDAESNAAHAATISTTASRVPVAVEPTNEEWIAASHPVDLLPAEVSCAVHA